ncbi:MAG: pyrroline-5-carboxylate reductase [Gemmatimonadota bacterium]
MDQEVTTERRIAVLGGGNLGTALAWGWARAGLASSASIHITRRHPEKLEAFAAQGFRVGADNRAAIAECDVIVLAVQPQQLDALLEEIAPDIDSRRHRVVSVVSGAEIAHLVAALPSGTSVVRAMPNTAVSIGESMTCLSAPDGAEDALDEAVELFDAVGATLTIREEMMIPATALCACGVAFFLRCIRAASQGGIEIGFHPEEALLLAGQTARGAAALSLLEGTHPEAEIDRVTTPRGCTIAGLNEMEHQGLSSALIKGLIVSAKAAGELYE